MYYATFLSRRYGNRSAAALAQRLRLRTMTSRDWKYLIVALMIIGIFTGIIMATEHLLLMRFGIPAFPFEMK